MAPCVMHKLQVISYKILSLKILLPGAPVRLKMGATRPVSHTASGALGEPPVPVFRTD